MEIVIPGDARAPDTPGWAVLPPGATRGVVVVHEIRGRQPEIDAVADAFAARGYAAVVPDLFAGGWGCVVRALRDVGTGRGEAFERLRRARSWLAAEAGLPEGRVGIIGFCLGGGFALAAGPGWGAVSANYGFVPSDGALAEGGPLIACYGGRDLMMRREPEKLRDRLRAVGREGEVHVFPEVGHAFLTQGPPRWTDRPGRWLHVGYDRSSAEVAWERIFGFFDRHLPAP